MSQTNNCSKTFADELMVLLKNEEFKKFLNETINDTNDINYKDIKNDLYKAKEKLLKKKRQVFIYTKINANKNSQNKQSKSNEQLYNSKKEEKEGNDMKEINDSYPIIFFIKVFKIMNRYIHTIKHIKASII